MTFNTLSSRARRLVQALSIMVFALTALGLILCAVGAALGFLPWLNLPLAFGETLYANAGMWVQIGVATAFSSLVFMLPTNKRIMTLENSHRNFQISMDDVAQAYYLCHTADRNGDFSLSAEFDAVRERLVFMRDHPQLSSLEPGVLEIAAQMSQQSRSLAEVYSDTNVERAKAFLRERQQEADSQEAAINAATKRLNEIEALSAHVEAKEVTSERMLDRLDEKVRRTLEPFGYDISRGGKGVQNVFPFGVPQPAE